MTDKIKETLKPCPFCGREARLAAYWYINEKTPHMFFYEDLENRWSDDKRKGWLEIPLYAFFLNPFTRSVIERVQNGKRL